MTYSGHLPKGIKARISKRDLHSHVHCSIIHQSQPPECPFMGKWIKKTGSYPYTGILISLSKEGNPLKIKTKNQKKEILESDTMDKPADAG